MDAINNWWGDNSGPYHPGTNPSGTGDKVSDNVLYHPWTGEAPLTITANNASKIYGETKTFAGTEFTVSGLWNGDTVTSVTLTSAGAAASAATGTYSIVPSAAVGTGLDYYTIVYVNGTLTMNKATSLSLVSSPNPSSFGTVGDF